MMYGLFGIYGIFLLLLAGIAVWLIHAIVVAVTLPKRAVKEPACEACRYPVAGLTEMRCPECGTDLRITGIITRSMEVRRRGSMVGAMISWCILWIFVGLVGFIPITFAIAESWRSMVPSIQTSMTATHQVSSGTGLFKTSAMTVKSDMDSGAGQFTQSVHLDLIGPSGTKAALYATGMPPNRFTVTHADGTRTVTSTFSRPEALGLLAAAGVDPKSSEATKAADDLATLVSTANIGGPGPVPGGSIVVQAGTPTTTSSSGTSSTLAGEVVTYLASAGLWFVIGLWIASLLWRRRRRLQRQFGAAVPVPARPAAAPAPADNPSP